MLQHLQIPVTPFMQNCSLLWCDQTLEAALVDPGGDVARLEQAITERGLKLTKIWLTHGHLDHVGGTAELLDAHPDLTLEGPHQDETPWLEALDQQSQMFNFPKVGQFEVQRWLQEGDQLTLGEQQLEVRFTPGHTPGHLVFYSQAAKVVFVGDVLFAGGIGRTDFPMGNHNQLLEAIRQKLYSLPDDTTVVPGHGPNTTIGKERTSNPYVTG